MKSDFLIIGAGVVGIAIARALRKKHNASILVIEKELTQAKHASGRNSGVIHAGVYYGAGSLKARLCVEGNRLLREFCHQKSIQINESGKVIVARDEDALPGLEELYKRSTVNGVNISWLSEQDLASVEPSAVTHHKALWVKDTAVVDPVDVTTAMYQEAKNEGINFLFDCSYQNIQGSREILTTQGKISYGHMINCAGTYADKIAHQYDVGHEYHILPFRGNYYHLNPELCHDIRGNIYPVPDLRNPFLGVHFTKRPDGNVIVGPTALPLIGREQYAGFNTANTGDTLRMGRFLMSLLKSNQDHFRSVALEEMMKATKFGFFREAKHLVKKLSISDLKLGRNPGIRAQLIDTNNMKLINDFLVLSEDSSTHILNAVSPAFTCSLSFSEYVLSTINTRN
jgi:L-2-hydroxyglutarate oxidase LhgO